MTWPRIILPFLVLTLVSMSGIPQLIVERGMPAATSEVPLALDGYGLLHGVGLPTRGADHATVAINDNLDVAIAFHTSRRDISGNGTLKQVEVAYFEYQSNDTWIHLDTRLVGSVDYSPITQLTQTVVKCERPDVIAVGERFFVTWTRRYDSTIFGQELQPAVLECAWLERGVGSSFDVIADPIGQPGLGFVLDAHLPGGLPEELFHVLECAGVPDAVALSDSTLAANHFKVAVAYPHQVVFSDAQGTAPSLEREFDLRLVTCTLDSSGSSSVLSSSAKVVLESSVPFHGFTSPSGTASAGLVLPDCAPSAEDTAFWLAFETQTETIGPNPLPNGVIKLGYWQQISDVWQKVVGKSYKSAPFASPMVRRRPMISSYPLDSSADGVQAVSIAFATRNPDALAFDQSANAVYAEWSYLNGNGHAPPLSASPWPNSELYNDEKPVPLRGTDVSLIRRCFADRSLVGRPVPSSILSLDSVEARFTPLEVLLPRFISSRPGNIGRPAVSYQSAVSPGSSDYVAVTFEKHRFDSEPLRIWFGVE